MIIAGQKTGQLDSDENWTLAESVFVWFPSFPVFVVLEGTVSGSSDYDRMEVKWSVA